MRTRRRATDELRLAIACLPRATRVAMLAGIEQNAIIVGAYSNHEGICPMLAAHRAGGRTSLIAFADAWDRFAGGGRRLRRARRASERELLVLRAHLEASLLEGEMTEPGALGAAIADHRRLVWARKAARRRTREGGPVRRERAGNPDRTAELERVTGWAWSRLFRRYDEYARAVQRLSAAPGAPVRGARERAAARR